MIPSIPQILILLIVVGVLLFIPYAIFGPAASKAGFSKWWSLLMVVPVLNILVIWAFAYIDWPAESGNHRSV